MDQSLRSQEAETLQNGMWLQHNQTTVGGSGWAETEYQRRRRLILISPPLNPPVPLLLPPPPLPVSLPITARLLPIRSLANLTQNSLRPNYQILKGKKMYSIIALTKFFLQISSR